VTPVQTPSEMLRLARTHARPLAAHAARTAGALGTAACASTAQFITRSLVGLGVANVSGGGSQSFIGGLLTDLDDGATREGVCTFMGAVAKVAALVLEGETTRSSDETAALVDVGRLPARTVLAAAEVVIVGLALLRLLFSSRRSSGGGGVGLAGLLSVLVRRIGAYAAFFLLLAVFDVAERRSNRNACARRRANARAQGGTSVGGGAAVGTGGGGGSCEKEDGPGDPPLEEDEAGPWGDAYGIAGPFALGVILRLKGLWVKTGQYV